MKLLQVILALLLFISLPLHAQSSDARQLDAAVLRAIGNHDIAHAKDLALTAEHWKWIKDAETGALSDNGMTRSDLRAKLASSPECAQARRHLQIEAGAFKTDSYKITTARSGVDVACGMGF